MMSSPNAHAGRLHETLGGEAVLGQFRLRTAFDELDNLKSEQPGKLEFVTWRVQILHI